MAQSALKIARIEDAPSLKDKAYGALKSAIMEMNIYDNAANLKLDERDLSLRLGISRTPIREALAQLSQEGFVRIVPRRGIYIQRKTKAEILEMITVWAALESMAARRATQLASDEDIAQLHRLVDRFSKDEAAVRTGEYSEANIRFHQAIIALGDCALLSDITNGLFFHVRAIRHRAIFEQDRARRSIVDHKRIVGALGERNADKAEKLVREHTLKLARHVEKFVELD